MSEFFLDVKKRIAANATDTSLRRGAQQFMLASIAARYSYNFEWLGRPIIQYPQDIIAIQELIWLIRPELIIETGIAHGGSLIFSASMLALLDLCEAMARGLPFDPKASSRRVIGIDIDIRAHNRIAIESHPLASRIEIIEGSSVEAEVHARVKAIAAQHSRVLVCLDSNHTHDHVLAELNAYAPLVSPGSYCVVFDTIIEDLPKDMFSDRPWGPGNSPKSAVREFLKSHPEFEEDSSIPNKLVITVAPSGYLRRVP